MRGRKSERLNHWTSRKLKVGTTERSGGRVARRAIPRRPCFPPGIERKVHSRATAAQHCEVGECNYATEIAFGGDVAGELRHFVAVQRHVSDHGLRNSNNGLVRYRDTLVEDADGTAKFEGGLQCEWRSNGLRNR